MEVVKMTTKEFEEKVKKSDIPVLIDFWAPWCGPCRALGPVVEEVAKEVTDVMVCKVNVDEEPELAREFKIMTIPTLMVFDKGEKKASSIGVISKSEILKMIQ